MNKKGQFELEHYVILTLGIIILGCLAYIFLYDKQAQTAQTTKEDCVNFMKGVSAKVNLKGVSCPTDMLFLNEPGQLVYYHFCEVNGNDSNAYILIPGLGTRENISFLWYYKNKTSKVISTKNE